MELPINAEDLEARFQEVRRSEYFPAILGAVAGGVTGALMAALIGGGRRRVVVSEDSSEKKRSTLLLGFTAGELLQLATVVSSLARQLRDWREEA